MKLAKVTGSYIKKGALSLRGVVRRSSALRIPLICGILRSGTISILPRLWVRLLRYAPPAYTSLRRNSGLRGLSFRISRLLSTFGCTAPPPPFDVTSLQRACERTDPVEAQGTQYSRKSKGLYIWHLAFAASCRTSMRRCSCRRAAWIHFILLRHRHSGSENLRESKEVPR